MRRPVCWLALLFLCLLFPFVKQWNWRSNLPEFKEERVILEGEVAEKSRKENFYGETLELTLKDVSVIREGKMSFLEGKYLVTLKQKEEVKIGRKVRVEASPSAMEEATNPGQFDLGKWYYSNGILGRFQKGEILAQSSAYKPLKEALWKFREDSFQLLKTSLGEKDGALIAAMILGEKSGLEAESKELYQRNGISHILAISGLHLSLLGMGVLGFWKRILPFPKTAAVISAVFMIIYCIFTGSSVSTLRATVMFVLSLLAGILNRSYDCLTGLALSSLILLFLNPYGLENSGFLLSFLAVIGVTYVAPVLKEGFQVKGKFSLSLLTSFSTTLVTLPVLLSNYGTYSWYSVFLNLLILPAMASLLGLSVVLILAAMLSSLLEVSSLFFLTGYFFLLLYKGMVCFLDLIQKVCALGIQLLLDYFELCCRIFEQLPFQDGYLGAPSSFQITVYSTFLILFLIFLKKDSFLKKDFFFGTIFLKKMLLLLLLYFLTLSFPTGPEITMLDVGQGDSIVIKNANQKVYLSDGGSSSVSRVGKYRLMPFLKEKGYGRIEAVFLSHLDQDHINGILELLKAAKTERVRIKALILSETVRRDPEAEEKLKELTLLAEENEISLIFMKKGDRITDGNLVFTCLHPGGTETGNNGSLVLDVSYGKFDLLLTGDVEKAGELEILKEPDTLKESENRKEQEIQKVSEVQKEQEIRKEQEQQGGEENRRKKGESEEKEYEVLKVAHHGSAGSSCAEFLQKISPRVSLISCGKNNPYGHPAKEVVERLRKAGSIVLDTRTSGAVVIYPKKDGSFYIKHAVDFRKKDRVE